MARRLLLNSRMGIRLDDSEVVPALAPEEFHGPGSAHTGYSEYNQRELLRRWADYLERPPKEVASVEMGKSVSVGGSPSPSAKLATYDAQPASLATGNGGHL